MTTVQLLIVVSGVLLLGAIVISGGAFLLYSFRKPQGTPWRAPISDLTGRVAALERRQTDLEEDIVRKLRRANSRLQRAQQQTEEDEEPDAEGAPAILPENGQPAVGTGATRADIVRRARGQ